MQAVAAILLASDFTRSTYTVRSRDCGICETALYTAAGLQHIMPLHSSLPHHGTDTHAACARRKALDSLP